MAYPNKPVFLLPLAQLGFILACVMGFSFSSALATTGRVLEEVTHFDQAEHDASYPPDSMHKDGPISESVIVAIIVVLLIFITLLLAFSCVWARRNYRLLFQRLRRRSGDVTSMEIPLDPVQNPAHPSTNPTISLETLPEYPHPRHPPPTYQPLK
ncbi:hypothetical protein VKT23_018113 [Stygiomarasmius scandens]|uniref:Uncharacterized protein n=1 Tax=Marasmiellus scandens TaxID=2682957 RepID=A0ABR1IQ62_9AGAR